MELHNYIDFEKNYLSPYACKCENSKGRKIPMEECEIRSPFQRDRDRILHCKSFRRLKHKTQVFLSPEGDHYRTRLSHTLEVSQIGRTIARALRLNEDLVEAIALGHDLGHTPFGHAGERILQKMNPDFTHYKQSVRVCEVLENDRNGLNLCFEVLDGILNHTGSNMASTLEGIIIKFADRIAYINHDIDDAIRGGILSEEDIPLNLRIILGKNHGKRIDTMIKAIIYESIDKNYIDMRDDILDATLKLRQFMFDNVYINSAAKKEEAKAQHIIEGLYEYFYNSPEKLPVEFYQSIEKYSKDIAICDYIAGMTDRFCVHLYEDLFIPKSWSIK